ncbi:MAG: chromosomal replication initiator protein DnaA [Planctomycetota bacterium]|nr:chromosomal replication initiator protein DnaA [Planctomycetota bacterium]MCX8040336.1 chromosomal replication initiator protein DnaA [Planctomycetota bacterium]MDW8373792.1 chromosomal replication initiator protein DnaA [Planctomycetota bacterium]
MSTGSVSLSAITALWPEVIAAIRERTANEPGVRLWLETPRVRPLELADGVLVIECPTALWAQHLRAKFAAALCAVYGERLGLPISDVQCRVTRAALRDHERAKQQAAQRAQPPAEPRPPVRARLRLLADFVVGPSNRLAFDAVQRLLEAPEAPINPLFIHGPSGVGKTHLEQGLAQAFRERYPASKVLYLRCEQFTNDYIEACAGGAEALNAFRVRVRHPDLLLIDDIHFLSKGQKERTKDELFATFEHLAAHGKKVVITSDAGPADIRYLEERFVQRFSGGLVVPLERPDPLVRCEVLRRRAREQGLELPDEVVDYVAQHITDSVRLLEGAVNRLAQFAHSFGRGVDLAAARHCLSDLLGRERGEDAVAMVKREVAAYFRLQPSDLEGRSRAGARAEARAVAMFVLRHITGQAYGAIGQIFGIRNHTSVLHACDRVRERRLQDSALDEFIEDLIARAKR